MVNVTLTARSRKSRSFWVRGRDGDDDGVAFVSGVAAVETRRRER